MSLTHPAAAADMEVDNATANNNASLAFDPNAQLTSPAPEGSDPNATSPVSIIGDAATIEVSRRPKAADHRAFFVKNFVAKLVDYLPDAKATIASLCQANGINVVDFCRLQTTPENPTPGQLEELYTFMGELGHT